MFLLIVYVEDEGYVSWKEGKFYGYWDVKWGEGMVRMYRFLIGRELNGVKLVYGFIVWVFVMNVIVDNLKRVLNLLYGRVIFIKMVIVVYNCFLDFFVMVFG